jgi:hypothetical protein
LPKGYLVRVPLLYDPSAAATALRAAGADVELAKALERFSTATKPGQVPVCGDFHAQVVGASWISPKGLQVSLTFIASGAILNVQPARLALLPAHGPGLPAAFLAPPAELTAGGSVSTVADFGSAQPDTPYVMTITGTPCQFQVSPNGVNGVPASMPAATMPASAP